MRANTNKLNFYVDDDVKKKLKKLSKESGLTMTAVIKIGRASCRERV